MDIIDKRQCFRLLPDGMPVFKHVKVIFRSNGGVAYGYHSKRQPSKDLTTGELQDVRPIPDEAFRPALPSNTTVVSVRDAGLYVKRPNLMHYEEGCDLGQAMLREINVCEVLRLHSHPNIAAYLGCRTSSGRVDGICFESYPETLMQKLNPGHLGKAGFIQRRSIPKQTAERYLSEIEAGIKHLHSLGYTHNDLTPMNVMVTDTDRAVLIDFDSALKIGEPFDGVKRTHGWHDRATKRAEVDVDYAALREIRAWLTSDSPASFQFRE